MVRDQLPGGSSPDGSSKELRLGSPLLSLWRGEVGTLVRVNNVWQSKGNGNKFDKDNVYRQTSKLLWVQFQTTAVKQPL